MRLRVAAAVAAAAMAVPAVAVALPWLVGLRVEHHYEDLLAAFAADGYHLVTNEYRRGWLQSRALLVIVPPGSGDSDRPSVQVAARIRHGPRSRAELLRWPPALASAQTRAALVDAPRALPPLLADVVIGPFGDFDVALRLPNSSYAGDAGRLSVTDVGAELGISANRRRWQASGAVADFEANAGEAGRLAVNGLGWRVSVDSRDGEIPLGELSLAVDGITLEGVETLPALSAAGLRLSLRTRLTGPGRVAADATVVVDRLSRQRDEFAPSRATLSLTGLDAASLGALWSGFVELGAQALPASMRGLALGGLLTEQLPVLLASGPRVELAPLEVTTPHGLLTASLWLGVEPPPAPADGALPSVEWLSRLNGEARLSAPQPLMLQLLVGEKERRVREELRHRGEPVQSLAPSLKAEVEQAAQASLTGLIRDGWLAADGGRLGAAAVIGDGLVTVNGKTWPILRDGPP